MVVAPLLITHTANKYFTYSNSGNFAQICTYVYNQSFKPYPANVEKMVSS